MTSFDAPRAPFSSFALLSSLSALSLLAVTSIAHAEPGCYDGAGACIASEGVGPCDEMCPTGYCVGDRCMHPADCEVPCGTAMGECPPIKIGNNIFRPEGGMTAGICFYGTGCGPLQVSASGVTTSPSTGSCLHVGDTGVAAFLHGDCDRDEVPNVAEGTGQFCVQQSYAGPGRVTATPTCPMTCDAGCVGGFEPHGGVVCASDDAGAYACMSPAECPSTFDRRVVACLPTGVTMGTGRVGVCFYDDVCGELVSCFDFAVRPSDATAWFTAAYDAGDCDGDGVLNGDDPADCGTRLVEWGEGEDPFHDDPAPACPDASACTSGTCSTTLEVCSSPDSVGVACDPSEDPIEACTALLGRAAQCVFAGETTDTAVGICVPIGPADDLCLLRGRDCFARGMDPAHAYDEGDCDGDGLANAIDDAVCTPLGPDAGTGANTDAGPVMTIDAGDAATDAGSSSQLDAASSAPIDASAPDAGEPGRFAGSGCGCRAHDTRRTSGGLAVLALLVVGLVTRRTRRR